MSPSLLINIPATTVAATGCFRPNHRHVKCTTMQLSGNCNVEKLIGKENLGSNSISISSSGGYRLRRRRRFDCRAQLAGLAPAASAAYGLILFGGGLFAYQRSGSKGSLIGGLTGAALMGAAFFLMQVQETKDIGDALGFGSAFIFCFIFGTRLASSRELTPAGPLLGISVFALAVFISAYLQNRL